MRPALRLAAVGLLLFAPTAGAQTFTSGSTGADGPLSPQGNIGGCTITGYYTCNIQVPESGVLNYTTVDLGPWSVRFLANSRNTPVLVLASGDMLLSGSVNVSTPTANSRTPGPGGFYGGSSQFVNGFGPGGGTPTWLNGRWFGPLSLVPITGGSGGAALVKDTSVYEGGGGGGAIVFASSGLITVTGAIRANGAGGNSGSGHGAGGAIRIVANQVVVTDTASLYAQGGNGAADANPGIIRIEAPVGKLSVRGTSTPAVLLSDVNLLVQPDATTPTLIIASMGGFPVTRYAGSIPDSVDLLLPATLTDPIPLVVNASSIPVGTAVTVTATGSPITFTGGVLAGTTASSTTTLQVSGLVRTTQSHLFVQATFDVPTGAGAANPAGPDHVASVRMESAPGGPSRFEFLRADGSVVPSAKLRPEFLAYFAR